MNSKTQDQEIEYAKMSLDELENIERGIIDEK